MSEIAPVIHPTAELIARLRSRLAERDPALARVDELTPAFEWRVQPAGYPALLLMIVGQQVSTASADAVWNRLERACGGKVTPEEVLALGEDGLRAVGFSRQKARYARLIAETGLDHEALRRMPCDDAVRTLTALTGVGFWTAECYLLMSEGRLDAFPGGDIALQEAIRWADGLELRPDTAAAYARAAAWRPYRGVAAHLLWAWYMGVKSGQLAR